MARGVTTVLVGASLLTGCGSKAAYVHEHPPATALPPGQGGDHLVLRWQMTAGIGGLGGPGTIPDFSLYADGTAIASEGPGKSSPLKRYHLKQAAAQKLFDEAGKAGLQRSRKIRYNHLIADANVLVIWMGSARTEVVMPQEQHVAATAMWKKLQPEQWPAADQLSPPDVYRPERLAAIASETSEHPAPPGTVPWPLSPLGTSQRADQRCQIYSGKDATRLRELASKPDTRFSIDGKVYVVRIRPLLPDEKSCDPLG